MPLQAVEQYEAMAQTHQLLERTKRELQTDSSVQKSQVGLVSNEISSLSAD